MVGGGASQPVEFVSGQRLGLDDERGEELRFDVAGVPEIEREFAIKVLIFLAIARCRQVSRRTGCQRAGLLCVVGMLEPPSPRDSPWRFH